MLPATAQAGFFGAPEREPALIERAESLSQEDQLGAVAMLEQYIDSGEDEQLIALSRLHAGEILRLMGSDDRAVEHFQVLANQLAGGEARDGGILGIAIIDADSGEGSQSNPTLRMIPDAGLPDTMNADRYRIVAMSAYRANGGETPEATAFAETSLDFAQANADVEHRVRRQLSPIFETIDPPDGETLSDQSMEDSLLQAAREALYNNHPLEAEELVASLLATFPETRLAERADWISRRAAVNTPFSPRKIGVLLPLTGRVGPAGLQIQSGLELALEGSGIELISVDTEGDLEIATSAFEQMVLTEGVSAIVGPMLRESSAAIAELAEVAEIPLISFSQASGLTELGPFVFRGMVTKSQQISSLLEHVFVEREISRFAILAPETPYGQDAASEFSHQVIELGGEVARVAFYDPDSDMREAVQVLGQKDLETRRTELWRLRRDVVEDGGDPDNVMLPPIIDFDAIFVPDNAARVPMVAAALAYEEFAIGGFKPKRDMTALPLLGLNGWNNPRVAENGGLYVRNSAFVDAFTNFGDENEATVEFVADFSERNDRSPVLFEALAYDVGRILSAAIDTSPSNHTEMREAITTSQLSESIAGGGGFSDDGEVVRTMRVLTITGEGLVPWVDPDAEVPPSEEVSTE